MKEELPTGMDFLKKYIEIDNKGYHKAKNINDFKEKIRGLVSYYRGAPPYTFPKKLPEIVKCEMSPLQLKTYKKILKDEEKIMNNKTNSLKDVIPNNFFIGTRTVSNIVYPGGKCDDNAYKCLKNKDLELSNLKILSPKFYKIINNILKAKYPIFVYSNFKEYGGIKTLIKALEIQGFKNYADNGHGKNTYAVWSGDQTNSEKDEFKAVFNNYKNKDGSYIKVIFGSPSIKEGVSLLRVREVHILEPYWNMSRLEQVIGRAVRFCSHKDLPEEERNVKVFLYLAVHKTIKSSIDQHIYKIALEKKVVVSKFEKAIKEMAVDCKINYHANVYPGEQKIKCQL